MPKTLRRATAARTAAATAAASFFLIAAPVAHATVSLSFTDNDATPTSRIVTAGSTFLVTLNLVSTAEQTTGLDYYLRDQTYTSGAVRFAINDRNMTGSPYNDDLVPDATVEASPSNQLNGDNDHDLGALLANVNQPLGTGTHLVANYTIGVSASTPAGTYTLQTFSPTTPVPLGYNGPDPFTPVPFNQHASFSVTVVPVPEPTALGLVGLGFAAMLRRRRPAVRL